MHIKLIPHRGDAPLTVTKAGEVLTINGEAFDFSIVPEGATLPASDVNSMFVFDRVERSAGLLQLTLLVPCSDQDAIDAVIATAALLSPADGLIIDTTEEGEE
jgi:hypothetical protein